MPLPQRTRILSLAVGTAAATGLGMIPVHRLPRPVRTGYVLLPAVLTTGVSLLAQQGCLEPSADDAPSAHGLRPPTVPEATVSLALGGLMVGAGVAGLCLDRGAESFLRRRGVPAPRLWIGLATGAVTLATTLRDAPDGDVDGAGAQSGRGSSELESRVLALLNREDPMGLAPGTDAMPEDEYGPEAGAIAELLDTGAAPTAAQLDEVWEHWFSQPLSPLLGTRRMESLLGALSVLVPEGPGA
jgi:hypothetical protein